jgi:hypothetical protein
MAGLTSLEKTALRHVAEWQRYSRSPQARQDAEQDKVRRAKADRAAGHSPLCTLAKCHSSCPTKGKI